MKWFVRGIVFGVGCAIGYAIGYELQGYRLKKLEERQERIKQQGYQEMVAMLTAHAVEENTESEEESI